MNVSFATMLRPILRGFIFILIASAVCPALAQQPAWQHTSKTDPLTGITTEQFVVAGVYLVSPYPPLPPLPANSELTAFINSLGLTARDPGTPKLIFECENGVFTRHAGVAVGLPVTPGSVRHKLDMVADAGARKSISIAMTQSTERMIATDANSNVTFDLGELTASILSGHVVTLIARMDGAIVVSGSPRQVLMEFSMPDPSPIYMNCSTPVAPVQSSVQPSGPGWQHTTFKDPLTDKVEERFLLTGEYLVPTGPSALRLINTNVITPVMPSTDTPKLVLTCAAGKLVRHYGLARGLPISSSSITTRIDMTRDAGRKQSTTTTSGVNSDRSTFDDRNSSPAFDLKPILTDLLNSKLVTIVLRMEISGTASFIGTRPQTLIEFQMPSPAPILAACGGDRLLKDVKP